MKPRAYAVSFLLLLIGLLLVPRPMAGAELKTKNVILITTDGLRWKDVFTGADPELMNKQDGGINNTNEINAAFWRETPEERREAMMPFMWNVIAKQGQIFGNQKKNSIVQVTNGRNFSYPGYNEILTGWPNPNINSNAKMPNPNPTVLEWLHNQRRYRGKVAAFSAWDVVPYIINRERAGFPVMGGWEPLPEKKPNERQALLNDLIAETPPGNNAEVFDSFLFHAAEEHLLRYKPRVMFFSFLETDHFGHAGRYGDVLQAAHRVDDYIRRIWETVQSHSQYRNKTTLIISTDHGRGPAPTEWKNHGAAVPEAENIWMAFLGPDTPALGERENCPRLTQSQIAATLAAFLGEDYRKDVPQAGEVVQDVISRRN